MTFTQIIEVEAPNEEKSLHELMADWDADQSGVAPGYQGCRLFADQDRPGHFFIEVDFSSQEEAQRNNDRPETAAWAQKVQKLVTSEPTYRNLRQVCTTYE